MHSGRPGSVEPTTAVIVAAGKGSRLRAADDRPKPLVPVVGVPLIARVMASGAKAGCRRFVVVIGDRAAMMRAALPSLAPPGCELELIENPRYDDPNGVSLLAAAQQVKEPFVLLMSDHLFSPDRLAQARAHFAAHGRNLLVVEPKETFAGDLDDATRVAVSDGRVTAIGKGLEPCDAIDTGLFILHPDEVTAALRGAGAAPAISDGMRRLARDGRLDAVAISGGYWQDVDTPDDIRAAERKLYGALTKPTDGLLARLINRRVSLALSTRLWRYGVTPNMMTGVTLLLGLLAGAAFAQGSGAAWGLLGAALFQLHSIVDGVDGELARLLHKESRFGFWFDLTTDNVTHMAVFGGIALGQMAGGAPGPWGLLGLLAVFGVAASVLVMVPLLQPGGRRRGNALPTGLLRSLVEGLSRRDFTYLLFPLALFEWLGWFLWVAAIGAWLYVVTVVVLRMKAGAAGAT